MSKPGILTFLKDHERISPLVVFRIIFGLMMFGAILRFWVNGWIEELYIQPEFFFSYDYFEWVKPLGDPGTYFLFALAGISALFIAFGLLYRFSAAIFFLSFSYIELMDKTNYLNHYYFVSLVAFLLIFIPAHRSFSLDVKFGWAKPVRFVSRFYRHLLIFQLGVVYFFAGLAKLNSDWLLEAQPMDIWLKAFGHWPVIGEFFDSSLAAYSFSWAGAFYDLTIPFFLYWNRTRPVAYLAVIFFHVMTAIFFPIGMFPYVMIGATLIFFPPRFHTSILNMLGWKEELSAPKAYRPTRYLLAFASLFAIVQLLLPFRSLFVPGELFWHEQGYRFSWRVMLMEKTGTAFFYVQDENMQRPMEVRNSDFLTPNQEKMMSTQPDMLVEYASFLKSKYEKEGMRSPKVTAKVYVTLNGRPSKLFIDPDFDLATADKYIGYKPWILPFEDEISGF